MELIVTEKIGIWVQCLYYGYKQENMVSKPMFLHFGDLLTISDQGKYVFGVGWYILIDINGENKSYIKFNELEIAIAAKKIESVLDKVLSHFILSHQLDKSLQTRNKKLFLHLSAKQKESSFLFGKITNRKPLEKNKLNSGDD